MGRFLRDHGARGDHRDPRMQTAARSSRRPASKNFTHRADYADPLAHPPAPGDPPLHRLDWRLDRALRADALLAGSLATPSRSLWALLHHRAPADDEYHRSSFRRPGPRRL